MDRTALRAHFNGVEILLDEPCRLEPNTELLVTILPGHAHDSDRDEWLRVSGTRLAEACEADEPEYSIDLIKEPNPAQSARSPLPGGPGY